LADGNVVYLFTSTETLSSVTGVPNHIAIIMDGNGRWAKKHFMPRFAGHMKGFDSLKKIVGFCIERNVQYLTVFAFSSENWRRPPEEVSLLMGLFSRALEGEVDRLNAHQVRLRIVGDMTAFDPKIQSLIEKAEADTACNTRLHLTIAANYGGRWDVLQAAQKLAQTSAVDGWSEASLSQHLSMAFAPDPDLFIRTGGEQRISNFLLWQLAYSELYFTDVLWPEFGELELDQAISSFASRERRFGRTSDQVQAASKVVS
jgi:undecaprenyl diphosphate synthase